VELVNINKEDGSAEKANDRAAENIDHMAAQYQSIHDDMTSVLNAGAFYELTRGHILKNPDLAWVLISANIMNFRLVNTLFGVLKGNEVLVKTAEMLKRIEEEAHGLCGRLGSDQFALLLPRDKYSEDALLGVQRDLADAFNAGIYTFIIHFGVYKVSDPSTPVSVMYGRANSALRTIRESLKDTVAYFDSSLMTRLLFEHEVVGSFSSALKEKQFHMYLQPLAGENGVIFGAEALVRWIKPDGRMIMPGDFIEFLEQAGFIHELICIFGNAPLSTKRMDGNKRRIEHSVNMSVKDFITKMFISASDLVKSSVEPNCGWKLKTLCENREQRRNYKKLRKKVCRRNRRFWQRLFLALYLKTSG
jgi:predicted signal transduction protein with EAL and GGDEF domain